MKRALIAALILAASLTACSTSQQPGTQPSVTARLWANLKAQFTDGNKELQKAFDAKQHATSWRMKTTMRSHPGSALVTDTEVSCPNRERMTTSMGDAQYETIRIGAEGYLRTEKDNWKKAAIRDDYYPCGAQQGQPAPWALMTEGRDIMTAMAMLAKNGTVTRGALVNSDSGQCQQWVLNLSHPGGGGRGLSYTVCIGDDHLPREVFMGSGMLKVTYSDWNQPITINEPPNAAQIPEVEPADVAAAAPAHGMTNPHMGVMGGMGSNPHAGIPGAPQNVGGMQTSGGQKQGWVKK